MAQRECQRLDRDHESDGSYHGRRGVSSGFVEAGDPVQGELMIGTYHCDSWFITLAICTSRSISPDETEVGTAVSFLITFSAA